VLDNSRKARDWDLPDLTRMMPATGCRIGECLAIGWSDVDLDAAVVEVRWRLVRHRNTVRIVSGSAPSTCRVPTRLFSAS
jgi:integrase